jgi:hypothetical protein
MLTADAGAQAAAAAAAAAVFSHQGGGVLHVAGRTLCVFVIQLKHAECCELSGRAVAGGVSHSVSPVCA